MARTHCAYCNTPITTRSSEHVIHNALGGLYESTDICCPECNNYTSREIDVPFTTTFNPIIGNMPDLIKSRRGSASPAYTGTVSYQGQQYRANFKGGKVTGCPELSKQLRCDAAKLTLDPVSFDFNIKNRAFGNGIAKIAFNYALDKGIDPDLLRHGLDIKKDNGRISGINFTYPIVPFYPLNPIDIYMELSPITELYHNMILFSQHNKLWCYIDLFNTFQYYVLLSENMPTDAGVYDNYLQFIQRHTVHDPLEYISRPKDILIYAQQYNVEWCNDMAEMKRRIKHAAETKSYKQDMGHVISHKINSMAVLGMMEAAPNLAAKAHLHQSLLLYFDDNDNLIDKNFRTVVLSPDCEHVWSYPQAITATIPDAQPSLNEYTHQKFIRLNKFLVTKSK